MGILNELLGSGVHSSELAYIKPCTQCEAIQLLWKYCYNKSIEFISYDAPIIYYSGYTHSVISNDPDLPQSDQSIESRQHKVKQAILSLANGTYSRSQNDPTDIINTVHSNVKKRYVIIDGVGYPSVGSCVNLSNATVSQLVNSPILLVGRSGVGNSIDSMNYMSTYFKYNKCHVLGAIFNKIEDTSYHTINDTIKYTTLYYKNNDPSFHIYGHIPVLPLVKSETSDGIIIADGASCRRKIANANELSLQPHESVNMNNWLELFHSNVNIQLLIHDIDQYWDNFYSSQQ